MCVREMCVYLYAPPMCCNVSELDVCAAWFHFYVCLQLIKMWQLEFTADCGIAITHCRQQFKDNELYKQG